MRFYCPECSYENEIETEELPDRACDDLNYQCTICNHWFAIGWYAEVEIRNPNLKCRAAVELRDNT